MFGLADSAVTVSVGVAALTILSLASIAVSCLLLRRWRAESARATAMRGEWQRLQLGIKTVADNSPIVMFSMDSAGTVTVSEGKGLAAIGLRPGQIVGLNALEVFHDAPWVVDELSRAIHGDSFAGGGELDGRSFETHYVSLRDEHSNVLGVTGVAVDVTERDQAERAARLGEERFAAVLRSNALGVVVSDREGKLTQANDAFLHLVGYTHADVQAGRLNALNLTPLEWHDATRESLDKIKEAGSWIFEKEYLHRDGRHIPVIVAASYLPSLGENIAFAVDNSMRKRAERLLRLLVEGSRLLAEYSSDLSRGLQGVADLLVNAKLVHCCSIGLLSAPSRSWRVAAHAHDGRNTFPGCALAAIGWSQSVGMPECVGWQWGVPLRARGTLLGAMALANEHALCPEDLRLCEDLAQRLAMAMDNARLFEEAQEAVRLRDRFLGIVAHELKTPLTPMQLQVDSILRTARQGNVSVERLVHKSEVIAQQVSRLVVLINDLLDTTRISAGLLTLHLQPMDLVALTREIVERFTPTAAGVGCELAFTAPAQLLGCWDALRVEQVLTNLLVNAIKYGPGKRVAVDVRADGPWAQLSVCDHGIGIADKDQVRIFDRFERATSERNYGGLGLGLWIVREIVDSMDGNVSVQSVPSKGATFTVRLLTTLQASPEARA